MTSYLYSIRTMIEDFDGYNNIYIKPYCRIGPYLIGSMLGYIMFKTKCRVRMHKVTIHIYAVIVTELSRKPKIISDEIVKSDSKKIVK